MSEIFISYASADRQRIQPIINFLQKEGWSVWWDRKIPLGRTFDDVIEEAIERSECMIVIWSKASVRSKWVRNEAGEGDRRGILVPIQIEDAIIPLAFRRIEAAQLADWDGISDHPELENLVEAVSRHIKPSKADKVSFQTPKQSIEEKGQLSGATVTPVSAANSLSLSDTQMETRGRSYGAFQDSVPEKLKTEPTITEDADTRFDKGSVIGKLWKPILLISILWSVINLATFQLTPSPTILARIINIVFTFIHGISIGFLLSLVFRRLQWKHIFIYAALWAIGGIISSLPFYLENLSPASSSIISQIISLPIRGIIFGLFLRSADPGIESRQVVTSAIGWLVITFIGGFLNSLIFSAVFVQTDSFAFAGSINGFISGVIDGVAIISILFMIKRTH